MYCAHDNRVQVIIEPEKRRWCLTKLHVALWDHVSLHVHVNIHIQYCLCTCTHCTSCYFIIPQVCHLIYSPWNRSGVSWGQLMSLIKVAIYYNHYSWNLVLIWAVFFLLLLSCSCVFISLELCVFNSFLFPLSSSLSLRVPLFLSTPFSLSLCPFSSLLLPPPLSFSFPQVYSVISSGLIPIKRPSLGAKMTEVYPSRLGQRLYQSSFANTTWIWSVVLIRYNRLDVQY